MENSHKQSSKSASSKPPRSNEPGSLLKAVLLGVAVDIAGSIVVRLAVGILYGVMLASDGQSAEQIQKTLETIDVESGFWLVSSLCGFAVSGLAGFVCARTANVNSYTAVGILSAISVATGTLLGSDLYEWETLLLLNLFGLVLNFLGGWWYIRRLAPQS